MIGSAGARRVARTIRDGASVAWWRASLLQERRPALAEGRVLFVIGQPRTGTNLVRDLLNQIDGVTVAGELLNAKEPGHPVARTRREARRFLDEGMAELDGRVVGCKLMVGDLVRWRITVGELERRYPDARYVAIRRRDLLAQYLSLQLAIRTDQWTSAMAPAVDPDDVTLALSPDHLRAWCDAQVLHHARAARLPRDRTASLVYEDLDDDPAVALAAAVDPLLAPWCGPAAMAGVSRPAIGRQRRRRPEDLVPDLDRLVPDRSAPWLWLGPPPPLP